MSEESKHVTLLSDGVSPLSSCDWSGSNEESIDQYSLTAFLWTHLRPVQHQLVLLTDGTPEWSVNSPTINESWFVESLMTISGRWPRGDLNPEPWRCCCPAAAADLDSPWVKPCGGSRVVGGPGGGSRVGGGPLGTLLPRGCSSARQEELSFCFVSVFKTTLLRDDLMTSHLLRRSYCRATVVSWHWILTTIQQLINLTSEI